MVPSGRSSTTASFSGCTWAYAVRKSPMARSSYLVGTMPCQRVLSAGPACQTGSVAMETKRWFNPSQPQTLQIAVWLLYFNAIGGLLLGSFFFALGPIAGLASLVGCGAAAFGIANEQRW